VQGSGSGRDVDGLREKSGHLVQENRCPARDLNVATNGPVLYKAMLQILLDSVAERVCADPVHRIATLLLSNSGGLCS
jgi:hypothetical protein